MNRVKVAALLIALPVVAVAQNTAETLQRAQQLYEAFQIEAARPLLQQILSPTYLFPVTPVQKATAEKYLGATYADLGVRDSAKLFFQAALEFDPFTDLDRNKFAPGTLGVFDEAKASIAKVG